MTAIVRRGSIRPDGRALAVAAGVVAVLLLVLGSASVPAFLVLGAVAFGIAGLAAWHWPLPTLVGAALLTLTDGEVAARVTPAGIDLGPIGLSEPFLALVGLIVLLRAPRPWPWRSVVRDPALLLVAGFVGLALLSAVVNRVPPAVTALGIFMTVDAIAIYVIARLFPVGDDGARVVIAGIVGTVVVVALFGIAQSVVGPSIFGFSAVRGEFGEGSRITSIMGSPNMLAAVIGLATPFAVLGGRHLESSPARWAVRVGLVVLVLALLLTFSRGGWLAVGIGAVVGIALIDWRSLGTLVLAGAVGWGASAVLPRAQIEAPTPSAEASSPSAAPSSAATPAPSPTATPAPTASADGGGSMIESTIDRLLSLWNPKDTRGRYLRDGLRIVADNPVLGVGPGRYGGAAAAIIPSPVYEEYGATLFTYRTVHNFWLHLLGESGILGTLVFLAALGVIFVRLLRAARTAVGAELVLIGGAATMLLVVSLHSVTEMLFEGTMPAVLIWLALGVATAVALRPRREPMPGRAAVP